MARAAPFDSTSGERFYDDHARAPHPRRWLLRIAIAFIFVMAGAQKLAGAAMMVDVFAKVGIGQWFRYATGTIEIVAAALVLWPRTTFWGALLTLPVLAGAFLTQLLVLHGDVIHVLVIAALAIALAYLSRPGKF